MGSADWFDHFDLLSLQMIRYDYRALDNILLHLIFGFEFFKGFSGDRALLLEERLLCLVLLKVPRAHWLLDGCLPISKGLLFGLFRGCKLDFWNPVLLLYGLAIRQMRHSRDS